VTGPAGASGFSGFGLSGFSGFSGISITGPTGPGGPAGTSAIAFDYFFDGTSNTDAKPGAGKFRLNTITQNAATILPIDVVDANSVDISMLLDTLNSSTSSIKGQLRLTKKTNTAAWIIFNLIQVNSGTGYRSFIISHVASSSSSPFINGDLIVIDFSRTGDVGVTGPTGVGASGFSGTSGWSGFSGRSGFSGVSGYSGSMGPFGPTGPTGPDSLGVYSQAYSNNITVNVTGYGIIDLTLTGNTTLNLTGGNDGQPITLRVRQDVNGSRSITFGSSIRFSNDLQTLALSIGPFALDYITLRYNQADNKYDLLAFNRGFQ
jgi:hypothetical protein